MNIAMKKSGIDKRGSAGVLIGLLVGVLISIGAVVLFAPQSGKETRAGIKQKSLELKERVSGTIDDLVTLSHYDNRKIVVGNNGNLEYGKVLPGEMM